MSEYTNGYIEGQNRKGLQPASLYEAQRAARGISTGLMPETGREDIPHIIVETNRVRVKSQKMHGYLFTRPMEVWCRCSNLLLTIGWRVCH